MDRYGMLTKLHIENFRSISSLTLEFGSKVLLMGPNGGGKSSIFEVLAGIRELVIEGGKCEEVFPVSTAPRRAKGSPVRIIEGFEINLRSGTRAFSYELKISQSMASEDSEIMYEILKCEGEIIFKSNEHEIKFNGQTLDNFDNHRSFLANIPSSPKLPEISEFKDLVRKLNCIRVDPTRIEASSQKESRRLESDSSNFASWYRFSLQTDTVSSFAFGNSIKEVIGGLQSLNLRELGQGSMLLEASIQSEPTESQVFKLGFNELSEGQRSLIVLYAISHFLLAKGAIVCIDEPDNFVTVREIQPWLMSVLDLVDDNHGQLFLASHHPELLDVLAPDYGIILERDGSGPTTARRFRGDPESRLPPSELVARGWE